MDPITHGALGAACSQALFYKKDKKNAWFVGALSGMAPDLDVLMSSTHDPMMLFFYHRHFTHALSFIPLGGLIVAVVLLMFQRFREQKKLTLFESIVGYGTHGLLDACTSYGTVLFWPFSLTRVSWDLIAIVDPFFTVPLILGCVATALQENRIGVLIGLMIACLYLLLNAHQHHQAIFTAENYANKYRWNIIQLRAFPKLASPLQWRIAMKIKKHLFIGDVMTPLIQSSTLAPIAVLPLFLAPQLPQSLQASPGQYQDFTIFKWFTDDYLILVQKHPLLLADGRYLFGNRPLIALWSIQFLSNQAHVKKLNNIRLL